MITKDENGTTFVELGEGTTNMGPIYFEDGSPEICNGILFSNGDEGLGDTDVVLLLNNVGGAVAVIKGVIDVLATWDLEGANETVQSLKQSIETAFPEYKISK